ncbi:MAG: cytochrome c biogenesis protein ResB [Bacillus sp. (in: firmicutes)]
MKDVKCQCGHVNPHGTILCEACGRLLQEGNTEEVVDMRYEGTARRSQTYNKTVIDKIWSFFSSVKVGIWLIVITLIASALGTIYPQEMYIQSALPPEQYYAEEYGATGQLYYDLGLHNMYSSWWYILLVSMIGISLVICSLDRFIPLYRALKTQKVDRHEQFLKHQRLFGETQVTGGHGEDLELIKKRLKEKKYKVKEENGSILAEKNRFSRWGPYVNHIGLIIFLIGGALRFVPGMYMDERLWVREGESMAIPGTDGEYYLENKEFTVEVYTKEEEDEVFSQAIENNDAVAKNFQTDAILYKRSESKVAGEEAELEKVREQKIRVNEPLKVENLTLYQTTYKLNEFHTMTFALTDKGSGEEFGELTIRLNDPAKAYDLGDGHRVEIENYYPDFVIGDDGEPSTRSRVPNNPAFVFKMYGPDKPEGEVSFVGIQRNIEGAEDNIYKMSFKGIDTRDVTILTVRKDLTLPILALGGAIFMIGVIQGAYWHHRRIWVQRKGERILLAAHTNKNWYGLKRELSTVIDGLGLNEPEDRVDEKKSKL